MLIKENTLELRELQLVEASILKTIKKMCSDNNIKFFLRGGTALGAVKYGGFIPWDDDLDIAVPRDDYEKMIELFSNKVYDNKFKIEHYSKNNNIPCYFLRVYLTEQFTDEKGWKKNTKQGLHVMDILPLDGAPNLWILRKLYFLLVYLLRFLAGLSTDYSNVVNVHTGKQQKFILLVQKLKLQKLFPQKSVYNVIDKLYKYNKLDRKFFAGTITGSLLSKEIFKKDVWGNGALFNFEGEDFLVAEKYEDYVKQLYGKNCLNEEPEISKRKSHQI